MSACKKHQIHKNLGEKIETNNDFWLTNVQCMCHCFDCLVNYIYIFGLFAILLFTLLMGFIYNFIHVEVAIVQIILGS